VPLCKGKCTFPDIKFIFLPCLRTVEILFFSALVDTVTWRSRNIVVIIKLTGRSYLTADLSEPAERVRQLESDNARLTDRLATMTDRSSRLTRDTSDFRSFLSRDVLSPGRTQRLEDDCRNLQRKVIFPVTSPVYGPRPRLPRDIP